MTEICLISHLHRKMLKSTPILTLHFARQRRENNHVWDVMVIWLSGDTRVRVPQEVGVVAFRIPRKLDVVALLQFWNLDVVAFCPLKKCLGITMSWVICLCFPMSRFFGLVISMSWLFGLGISISWSMMCLHGLVFVFTKSINMAHNFTIKLTKWRLTGIISKFWEVN